MRAGFRWSLIVLYCAFAFVFCNRTGGSNIYNGVFLTSLINKDQSLRSLTELYSGWEKEKKVGYEYGFASDQRGEIATAERFERGLGSLIQFETLTVDGCVVPTRVYCIVLETLSIGKEKHRVSFGLVWFGPGCFLLLRWDIGIPSQL